MKPIILILAMTCGVALAAETGAELFQKAVVQERAAGNLEQAIKLYERVAKEFMSDRALAAKSLVQAARCYEKLGQDKAVKLYEHVAQEFSDQREPASAARERLSAIASAVKTKSAPGMVTRQIPAFGPGRMKQSDGRHVYYAGSGGLWVSRMDGTGQKVLFAGGPNVRDGDIGSFAISRDGKQVALILKDHGPESMWVTGVDGSGVRQVPSGNQPFSRQILDWSWDGARILASVLKSGQQYALMSISAADGSASELSTTERPAIRGKFSPDGKFVAYSTGEIERSSPKQELYVVSVNSGQGSRLLAQGGSDRLLDWTPDGAHILFLSDRTENSSLFALALSQGQPQGDPVLVKRGTGGMNDAFMAGDGTLYYSVGASNRLDLFVVSLVAGKGIAGASARRLVERGTSPGHANWSPDGRQIAYALGTPQDRTRHRVIIRDVESGNEREVAVEGTDIGTICWSSDGATVYEASADGPRHFMLQSVSTASGEAKRLAIYPERNQINSLSRSRDGKTLLIGFAEREPTSGSLPRRAYVLRRDIATGAETEVISKDAALEIVISPDETRVAALDYRGEERSLSMKLLGGGDWKRVATTSPLRVQGLRWMPDSSSVFFAGSDGAKVALISVRAEGGGLNRVVELPQFPMAWLFAIRPDGQEVLLQASANSSELWAIENLLPALKTAK